MLVWKRIFRQLTYHLFGSRRLSAKIIQKWFCFVSEKNVSQNVLKLASTLHKNYYHHNALQKLII
jgi:hypothetical protein